MKLKLTILLFFTFCFVFLSAQKTPTLIYIDQYKDIAIQEMKRTGIPASITLAQGIVESKSGESNLALNFNNHFGIKCKSDWKGLTTYQDDDTKQECFRVYPNANASFIDHSNFIKSRPNYALLFQLDPVDDSAWAFGLKKAGYATAADYPKKLLKVIDDYELSQFNFPELNDENDTVDSEKIPVQTKDVKKFVLNDTINLNTHSSSATISNIKGIEYPSPSPSLNIAKINALGNDTAGKLKEPSNIVKKPEKAIEPVHPIDGTQNIANPISSDSIDSSNKKKVSNYPEKIFKINQVSVLWVKKGSSFLQIATENNIPLYKIFMFNDLLETDLLMQDQLIFLGNKKTEGEKTMHTVLVGETLYDICQKEGIQLKKIIEYNPSMMNMNPSVGSQLLLVKPVEQKNKLKLMN